MISLISSPNTTDDGNKIPPRVQKAEIMQEFEEGDLKAISCAKSLEEGFSVNAVTMSLIASYTSDMRSFIQKMGRAVRFVPGKKAFIVCLYMKPFKFKSKTISSKEKAWLESAQKGNTHSIKWVDSVDEIVNEESISF